jgi:hypothetical protein
MNSPSSVKALSAPARHLRLFSSGSENAHNRLEGVGKVLGIVVLALIALRAGLAAVNVVQTAYNAVEAITNGLMAANPVGLVVTAIAALVAGFVPAYNMLKPFYDAVNTVLELLQARVTVGGVIVGFEVTVGGVIVGSEVAVVNTIVCCVTVDYDANVGGRPSNSPPRCAIP